MSGTEAKAYVALLCLADFKTGKVHTTVTKMSEQIGVGYRITMLALNRLELMKYIKMNKTKNQWKDTEITINKYVNAYADMEVPSVEAGVVPSVEAGVEAQASDQAKQASKNLEELKELKESTYTTIFNAWNSAKVTNHKKLSKDIRLAMDEALAEYELDDILGAIKNYGIIVNSSSYYFQYRWRLEQFIKGGGKDRLPLGNLKTFLDESKPLDNFKHDKEKTSSIDAKYGTANFPIINR